MVKKLFSLCVQVCFLFTVCISLCAEALGLALHHHGPTLINTYCQAATNLVDGD